MAAADDATGLDQAFAALARGKPQALVVASTGAMRQMRQEVAAHARRLRLPSISALSAETWIGAGGLIAYSPDMLDSFRKAAGYV